MDLYLPSMPGLIFSKEWLLLLPAPLQSKLCSHCGKNTLVFLILLLSSHFFEIIVICAFLFVSER